MSNSLHSWYGWAAAQLLRLPHVWHAREIVVQSRAALAVERRLAAFSADLLVSCSGAVDAQFAGWVADERRVVVHEDVDRDEFSPRHAGVFRRERGIPDDARLVGFVGRVDTWKGLDVLLEAWPAVRARVPDARLVVVGGDVAGKREYAASLRARAEGLDGVDWVGHRRGTSEVMADLDVLAAPSTLPEPYGLVLVEALASGARVVTTSLGGPPEIVARAAAGAGRLVPPSDAGALADAVVAALEPTRTDVGADDRVKRPVLIDPFPADYAAQYTGVAGARR